MKRTAKWIEKHGVPTGRVLTNSPYYGSLAGHRNMLVVAAHRNCSKHVMLELQQGRTMLVDDSHPVFVLTKAAARAQGLL
jgi:hypothetical protein